MPVPDTNPKRKRGPSRLLAYASGWWVLLCLAASNRANPPAPTKVSAIRDFIQHLQWSPDGKKFLFTRIHAGKMRLWTMNVDGSELRPLLPKAAQPHFDGHWSPDSKQIIYVQDVPSGTDGKFQLDLVAVEGGSPKTLLPNTNGAFEESPRWSPDGKQIAWTSTRDKNQDIWLMDSAGKNGRHLTNHPAIDNGPSWSPDGKHIAFASSRGGTFNIYVMNADGSDVRRLTDDAKMNYLPAWSPTGRHIAFTSNRDGNYDIYVMNADGSRQRNVTAHPAQDNYAAWSPDGRRLAFISNRGGGYDIYVVAIE